MNFMKSKGYTSPAEMIRHLCHGLINSQYTAEDVHRAVKLWGVDIAYGKSKGTKSRARRYSTQLVLRPIKTRQTLMVDFFFVDRLTFFIGVSEPLD